MKKNKMMRKVTAKTSVPPPSYGGGGHVMAAGGSQGRAGVPMNPNRPNMTGAMAPARKSMPQRDHSYY